MRHASLFALSALSIAAILACGGGGSTSSSKTSGSSAAPGVPAAPSAEAAPAEPPPPQDPVGSSASNAAPKGTAYTVNNIETTVTGAKITKKVSKKYSNYAATEGATLVVVDYTVKNTGTEPVQCMSYADTVTDSKGVSYDDTLECNFAIDNWAMDKINPGLPKKFQACFEVPEGTSGFTLHFNCGFKDGYFALGI